MEGRGQAGGDKRCPQKAAATGMTVAAGSVRAVPGRSCVAGHGLAGRKEAATRRSSLWDHATVGGARRQDNNKSHGPDSRHMLRRPNFRRPVDGEGEDTYGFYRLLSGMAVPFSSPSEGYQY